MIKDYVKRGRVYYTLIVKNGNSHEVYNYSGTKRQPANHQLDAQSAAEGTDAVVDLVTDPRENSGQKV